MFSPSRKWSFASVVIALPLVTIASCRAFASAPYDPALDRASRLTSCRPPDPAPLPVHAVRVMEPLTFEEPVGLVPAPAPDTWYVLERKGVLVRAQGSTSGWTSRVALDLRPRTEAGYFDAGLLGFALSPDFASTGEAFVMFTAKGDATSHRRVIARITSNDGGLTFTVPADHVVLETAQTRLGHYGGRILFGPDRLLYYLSGDGYLVGPGELGDPDARAQNPDELVGKVLRLDVLGGRPYRIPADNPFADGGGRPEVYALGLRNPWSGSFDEAGSLWVADVGHDRWEEIDIVTKGGNYGWPLREGNECAREGACDLPDAIAPIFQYSHAEGFCIVGGHVYRGERIPAIRGRYVFGDCVNGRISALERDDATGEATARDLVYSQLGITAIAEGFDRELYVADNATGSVSRLEPATPRPEAHATLDSLGCLDPTRSDGMAAGLIPYEINAPLWSDGLDKQRWMNIPEGAHIRTADDGAWELPAGSIVLKTFSRDGRAIETRMLARDGDRWLGYAFEWNEEQTDATLLSTAKTRDLGDFTWKIPARSDCPACHTAAAGRTLGLRTGQLNREVIDPHGVREDQLDSLERRGLFELPLPPDRPELPAADSDAPLEQRARAYLQANCSHCHRPLGPGGGSLDLRAAVPLEATRVACASSLLARMLATDGSRMPPTGTSLVDPVGTALVGGWIASLDRCRDDVGP